MQNAMEYARAAFSRRVVQSAAGTGVQPYDDDPGYHVGGCTFQSARYEAWGLEEGIIKSGSYSIEQGVGVRSVCGEQTGFAYSDEISLGSTAGFSPGGQCHQPFRAIRAG
ncbi:MAG: DNA gyrase modulator [Thiolinea sp.]